MKKGTGFVIAGAVMILLQLISIIGNIKAGVVYRLSFDNLTVFLYDLIFLLSSNLIGTIGVFLLIVGLVKLCKDGKK